MTEQKSGLRFDIYERIHLADGTVGMKELDEVELVPHIQVFTEGEQAVLKGNLYLAGKYQGETGGEARSLEHFIPVEITLPLNRIHDVNEVAVEIDNFDVDLISSRSLNVTGVLTLQGIEMISVPEESWQEEEETVFVHEAGTVEAEHVQAQESQEAWKPQETRIRQEPLQSQEEQVQQQQFQLYQQFQQAQQQVQFVQQMENVKEPAVQNGVSAQTNADYAQAEYRTVQATADEPGDESGDAGYLYQTETVHAGSAQDQEAQEVFASFQEPSQEPASFDEAVEEVPRPDSEEKQEVKVAFGSKASEQSYHLKSLIQSGESRSAAAAAVLPVEEQTVSRADALEWKRLFGSPESGEQQFRRLRMCILQKDETLETISQRYDVNAREILLHNRITEEELSEGKVLYIP